MYGVFHLKSNTTRLLYTSRRQRDRGLHSIEKIDHQEYQNIGMWNISHHPDRVHDTERATNIHRLWNIELAVAEYHLKQNRLVGWTRESGPDPPPKKKPLKLSNPSWPNNTKLSTWHNADQLHGQPHIRDYSAKKKKQMHSLKIELASQSQWFRSLGAIAQQLFGWLLRSQEFLMRFNCKKYKNSFIDRVPISEGMYKNGQCASKPDSWLKSYQTRSDRPPPLQTKIPSLQIHKNPP